MHRSFRILAGLALLAAVVAGPACRTAEPSFEDRFGIRIRTVRLTAAGDLVDVRYQVLDPARALAFHDKAIRPRLVSEATGKALSVPVAAKAGALRQAPREAVAGQTYFLLFRNTAGSVRAGDRVDLVVGDARSGGYEVL